MKRVVSWLLVMVFTFSFIIPVPVNVSAATSYREWKQTVGEWASYRLGTKSGTECSRIGCLVTSVAIAAVKLGCESESSFNPGVFIQRMKANSGFSAGGGISWSAMHKVIPNMPSVRDIDFDGEDYSYKLNVIDDYVNDPNYAVIIQITHHNGGNHYMVCDYIKDGRLYVLDPGKANGDLAVNYPNEKELISYVQIYKKAGTASYVGPVTEPEPPAHVHSFTNGTETAHPHRIYQKCACGTSTYTGSNGNQTNCKQCYPVGNVKLTRSYEKTKGTATFYRNDVANANSYTLTVYNNSGYSKEYSMLSTSINVSVPGSGLYFAMLTAKNTNTGEVRTATCESFKFVDTYNVSYNANGGKNAPASQTKIQDTNLTLSTAKPTREGYVFKGWAASKNAIDAQYPPGSTYTKNAKITLYAVWEPETYTITFDANGGMGNVESITIKYGDTIKMPNGVVCEFAYLKGWSTSKTANDATYVLGKDYKLNETTTLYAVWGDSTWGGDVSASLNGSGTKANPYEIYNAADLAYFAEKVNQQTSTPKYEYYVLKDNINLGYNEWVPIGLYGNENQYFYGSFDGNGYTISDMYITQRNSRYIGLFGYVKNADISNLTITGAIENINTPSAVGGIIGYAYNTKIDACSAKYFNIANISASTGLNAESGVGCIVGRIEKGTITNCNGEECHINLTYGTFSSGIIAGYCEADIIKCLVTSSENGIFSTNSANDFKIGAICGYLKGVAKLCTVNAPYFSNTIKTTGKKVYIGGIVGYLNGEIKSCAVNFTEGENKTADGTSYNTSIYSSGSGSSFVGGVAGTATENSKIVDCKYDGQSQMSFTTSGTAYVGGLAGSVETKSNDDAIIMSSQVLTSASLPSREGYKATWYTNEDLTNEYDFSTVLTKNITLYPKWEKDDTEKDIWDGTSKEPSYNANTKTYIITSAEELAWIADVANGDITSGKYFPNNITFKGYTVELTKDIYLNNTENCKQWGTGVSPEHETKPIKEFGGVFDGKNHCISGIYGDSLFTTVSGTVKNLYISDSYISIYLDTYAGGIAAMLAGGTIRNCYLLKNVCIENSSAGGRTYAIGGIVGHSDGGTIIDCGNLDVNNVLEGTGDVGGIAGYAIESLISDCINFAAVGIEGKGSATGGIVGELDYYSSVVSCGNKGAVKGYKNVGGIVGDNYGGEEISRCYNLASVSGNMNVGGICGCLSAVKGGNGWSKTIVEDCYTTAGISCNTNWGWIVGLISGTTKDENNCITIANCYSTGSFPRIDYNIYSDRPYGIKISNVTYLREHELKKEENVNFSYLAWKWNPEINDGYPYIGKYAVNVEVCSEPDTKISRSFAHVDGALYAEADENVRVGGVAGTSDGGIGSSSVIANVLSIVDTIGGATATDSILNAGYILGYNSNIALDTTYYESNVNIPTASTYVKINNAGTARSEKLMKVISFQKNMLGLNPYVSLANLENDDSAVWILKDGELPELYHNVLRDITISSDIENGSVAVDISQGVDGEIVNVTAVPDDGYVLNAIYVNGEEIIGSAFQIAGDGEIYAVFSEKIAEYDVKVEANDNATGTLVNVDNAEAMLLSETNSLSANDGEEIFVNTKANEDYAVDTIYVNGEEVAGNNFIVTSDSVVTMEVVSIDTEYSAITHDPIAVRTYDAILSGELVGESEQMAKYIRYWEANNPGEVYVTEVELGSGEYTAMVSMLTPETTYCYQMTEKGEVKTFSTYPEENLIFDGVVDATGITLDKSAISLTSGESETLTVIVEPVNATNQAVVWKSSNESVASVVDGVVKAKSAGKATITVTTEDGGFSAECVVTVNATTVPVTGISIDKPSVALSVGGFEQLTATILPSNATDKTITWSCNDESVAMVSSTGFVVGVGVGTAVVIAKANDGNYTAFCVVTVSEPTVEAPADPEITLSGTDPLKITLKGELTGKIVAALYNENNVMIEVKIFNAAESINVDFVKSGSYAKVMWVKNLSSLEPKCEAKIKQFK